MVKWKKAVTVLSAAGFILSNMVIPALADDSNLDFQLEQVVVTATKTEKTIKEVPASVTVIKRSDLEKMNIQSLEDALQYVAGVHIKQELGTKATVPSIRGMRLGNNLILLDGMPINNVYNGSYSFADIPLANIERVEVTRGSFSGLYGSNAMGGVINVITRNTPDNKTVIKAGAGTNNRRIGAVSTNGEAGKLDYFIDYYKNKTDGYYEVPTNRVGRENETYNLKLAYNFSKSEVLSFMAGRAEKEMHYENSVIGNSRKSDSYNLNYHKMFDNETDLNARISYRDSYGWTQANANVWQDMPMKTWDGDVNTTLKLSDSNRLTIGANYKTADSIGGKATFKGKLRDESGAKTKTAGFYLQDEIKLHDKLTWYIGGRYDYWKMTDAYQTGKSGIVNLNDRSESQFSPKTSLDYRISDRVTVYASAGRSFTSPNIISLVRLWIPNPSSANGLYPNPDLKPERMTSYEVGVNVQADDKTDFRVALFRSDVKDLIDQVEAKDNTLSWNNIPKSVIKGVELELNHEFNKALRGFFNYTYTNAEVSDIGNLKGIKIGNELRSVPRNAFNLGLNYNEDRWNVSLIGGYTSRMFDSYGNQLNTDGYKTYEPHFVVDTKLTYNFNQDSQLAFSVNNLFNRKYYLYDNAPGRTYLFEFTQKF